MTMEGQKHTAGTVALAPHSRTSVVAGKRLVAACGGYTSNVPGEDAQSENEANARRLAACWNACLGIPTEQLEAGAVSVTATPAADASEAYRVVEDAADEHWDSRRFDDRYEAHREGFRAGAALRPQQWLPITGELKLERKIAVTNNIGARNAHGEMNHVWLVDMVFASKERPGEYGAFDRNNRLYGLTHYADCLPAAPKQEG